MEKYCLLRGCCLGWINPVGRLQELSPLGHPRLLGSSLQAPPAWAHPLHAAAGKSQNLLAWKAPTKIIKVQLLKGAVQAIPAFCCPSGLCCCSANPAQASQLKSQSLAAVSRHSHVRGHWSVSDAHWWHILWPLALSLGLLPCRDPPELLQWAQHVQMVMALSCAQRCLPALLGTDCVRIPDSCLEPPSLPASKNRLWKNMECKYGPWQGEKWVLSLCAASLRGFWSPRSALLPVT